MTPPENKNKELSRLLADDYSQKILVSTYAIPMSAQRLSKICQIPVAAFYRRIHEQRTRDRQTQITGDTT